MLFNSLDYLLFLGISVAIWWLLAGRRRARLGFLFAASCLFYMAWHPAYIVLILGSTVLDFTAGWWIGRSRSTAVRRAWLGASLVGNLGLLGVFKYFNFAGQAVADVLALAAGVRWEPPVLDVLLPVGISFYTFQTLSYTIDVYRGQLAPTKNPLQFASFVTYFPQLVAGPIVRARELLPQLDARPWLDRHRVGRGLFLIALGMTKKVAVADYLAVNLVDRVFGNPEAYTATETVIGLYAFTMQLYCDFSGYTDVARGSALLMGIGLPENFDRPYAATNPADFWRRWHMTLSSWLRDYLYFPLGGSRGAPWRAYVNLGITMFLIGIWHGAAWTFVFYALLQAAAMVGHRFWHRTRVRGREPSPRWAIPCFVLLNLQFVVFSRILFRATSLENAGDVASRLWSGTSSTAQVSAGVAAVLLFSFAAHYSPRRWAASLEDRFARASAPAQGLALATVGAALALVATSEVVPYIYFQF
ncbi:MAG TPA: MBOAT family protein [Polyangiaceae bacterium LLY-WYZ-14_1]|nr:MBOAT family protein [Polyangiaceae bacterium LLY-WYZ-14_1]